MHLNISLLSFCHVSLILLSTNKYCSPNAVLSTRSHTSIQSSAHTHIYTCITLFFPKAHSLFLFLSLSSFPFIAVIRIFSSLNCLFICISSPFPFLSLLPLLQLLIHPFSFSCNLSPYPLLSRHYPLPSLRMSVCLTHPLLLSLFFSFTLSFLH